MSALEPALPAFLALLDVPGRATPGWQTLDPLQRRRRTLEAVKRLLLRESQVQPLAPACSRICTGSMARRRPCSTAWSRACRRRALLLLVNYRPEYEHGWGGKTYYTQLRLDPLPPRERRASCSKALLGYDAEPRSAESAA